MIAMTARPDRRFLFDALVLSLRAAHRAAKPES
jgi:hypothetical protein